MGPNSQCVVRTDLRQPFCNMSYDVLKKMLKFFSTNYTTPTNIVCGQDAKLLNVSADGIYSYPRTP
jgi:hypothetical protein